MRIGVDPWVSSGEGFKLSDNMINTLHKAIFFLNQAACPVLTIIWRQERKIAAMIGLVVREGEERGYTSILRSSHVRIKDDEDELI